MEWIKTFCEFGTLLNIIALLSIAGVFISDAHNKLLIAIGSMFRLRTRNKRIFLEIVVAIIILLNITGKCCGVS